MVESLEAGKEREFLIDAPAGKLEMAVFPSVNTRHLVVICHPHPLYGGTMENKVVTATGRAFKHFADTTTIRFNFRGIGNSTGEYGHGEGEYADLLAVLRWAEQQFPVAQIFLAGFSFGSYIAAHAVGEGYPAKALISLAPPVHHFAFQQLRSISCPWLVVQGDKDEIVPFAEVVKFVENRVEHPQFMLFEGAGHFFHGRLIELKERLISFLMPYIEIP